MFQKRVAKSGTRRGRREVAAPGAVVVGTVPPAKEAGPAARVALLPAPLAAPATVRPATTATVRSTTTVDYQPDVCKDFKKTGYCGYGDTCKFLHIRDAARPGLRGPKAWEQTEPAAEPAAAPPTPRDSCPLCSKPPVSPVETRCGHRFCHQCFFAHARTSPACPTCRQNTHGSARPVT